MSNHASINQHCIIHSATEIWIWAIQWTSTLLKVIYMHKKYRIDFLQYEIFPYTSTALIDWTEKRMSHTCHACPRTAVSLHLKTLSSFIPARTFSVQTAPVTWPERPRGHGRDWFGIFGAWLRLWDCTWEVCRFPRF